jgi:hypothetical protein
MKDSYEILIQNYINGNEILKKFGLNETIFISNDQAIEKWKEIKSSILKNEVVYVRRYGRGGKNDLILKSFYKEIFKLTKIKFDPSNNSAPAALLNKCTTYRKNIKKDSPPNEKIQNYQISHVFGRTKNPFLFTAPWNVVYVPKIVDPFTGHESRGDLALEFSKLLKEKTFKKYESLIKDYNKLIEQYDFPNKLNKFMDVNKNQIPDPDRFKGDMLFEFSKITLNK